MEKMIAPDVTALMTNIHPTPSGPINSAAIAGPNIREPVIVAVFNDITFEISSWCTSSVRNPRREGLSRADTTPNINVAVYTTPSDIEPVTYANTRSAACNAINDCVIRTTRCRFTRSDNEPAQAPITNSGPNCNAVRIPIAVVDSVRRSTTTATVVNWTHAPTCEIAKPPRYRRTLE